MENLTKCKTQYKKINITIIITRHKIPGKFRVCHVAQGYYWDVCILLMRFLIDFKQLIFSECIPHSHIVGKRTNTPTFWCIICACRVKSGSRMKCWKIVSKTMLGFLAQSAGDITTLRVTIPPNTHPLWIWNCPQMLRET